MEEENEDVIEFTVPTREKLILPNGIVCRYVWMYADGLEIEEYCTIIADRYDAFPFKVDEIKPPQVSQFGATLHPIREMVIVDTEDVHTYEIPRYRQTGEANYHFACFDAGRAEKSPQSHLDD